MSSDSWLALFGLQLSHLCLTAWTDLHHTTQQNTLWTILTWALPFWWCIQNNDLNSQFLYNQPNNWAFFSNREELSKLKVCNCNPTLGSHRLPEAYKNDQRWIKRANKQIEKERKWNCVIKGNIRGKESTRGGQRKRQKAKILRLIGFGGLLSIVSEDVTLSTEEAEAWMCGSVVVVRRSLSVAMSHREKWRWGVGGK